MLVCNQNVIPTISKYLITILLLIAKLLTLNETWAADSPTIMEKFEVSETSSVKSRELVGDAFEL